MGSYTFVVLLSLLSSVASTQENGAESACKDDVCSVNTAGMSLIQSLANPKGQLQKIPMQDEDSAVQAATVLVAQATEEISTSSVAATHRRRRREDRRRHDGHHHRRRHHEDKHSGDDVEDEDLQVFKDAPPAIDPLADDDDEAVDKDSENTTGLATSAPPAPPTPTPTATPAAAAPASPPAPAAPAASPAPGEDEEKAEDGEVADKDNRTTDEGQVGIGEEDADEDSGMPDLGEAPASVSNEVSYSFGDTDEHELDEPYVETDQFGNPLSGIK